MTIGKNFSSPSKHDQAGISCFICLEVMVRVLRVGKFGRRVVLDRIAKNTPKVVSCRVLLDTPRVVLCHFFIQKKFSDT